MTRINIHVPPQNLCDQHLMAEYREVKRIPNTIKSGKALLKDIPTHFTLGKGHVKFFYNKLGYLKKRYNELYKECLRRGFNIQDYRDCFEDIPEDLDRNLSGFYNKDRHVVEQRIIEKYSTMKVIRYMGQEVTKEDAIKILDEGRYVKGDLVRLKPERIHCLGEDYIRDMRYVVHSSLTIDSSYTLTFIETVIADNGVNYAKISIGENVGYIGVENLEPAHLLEDFY